MAHDPAPTVIDYARPDLRVPRERPNLDLFVGGTIIAILLLWRFAPVGRSCVNSAFGAAKTDISMLSNAINMYADDTGRLPTEEEGLDVLVEAPPTAAAWRGPYVKRKYGIPNDPWGRSYLYRPGSGGYLVLSRGPDGREGTADDLKEWTASSSPWSSVQTED